MAKTFVVHGATAPRLLAVTLLSLCAFAPACSGSDSSSGEKVSGSATLKSLTASDLTSLCKELLPVVKSSSTPAHACTLAAVASANDEDSCGDVKNTCVKEKQYDDWNKAVCKDFAADGGEPKYTCTTKVSDIRDCYDEAANWLNALSCKAADPNDTSFGDVPSCFSDLSEGDCHFELADLMKDKKFVYDGSSDTPDAYTCSSGDQTFSYEIGFDDACKACATSADTGCCDSWVACLTDKDCMCYTDCPDEDDVCFKQCGVSKIPQDFVDHANCLADMCAEPCGLTNP